MSEAVSELKKCINPQWKIQAQYSKVTIIVNGAKGLQCNNAGKLIYSITSEIIAKCVFDTQHYSELSSSRPRMLPYPELASDRSCYNGYPEIISGRTAVENSPVQILSVYS